MGLVTAPLNFSAVLAQLAQLGQQAAQVEAEQAQSTGTLAGVLSPSQVRTFRDCSAKWWYKYGLGLPDPIGGSAVRGIVVHRMAEAYYRSKMAGATLDPDDLAEPFDEAWESAAATAEFQADEDVDALRTSAAVLTRKYLDEVAPEIEPAAMELLATGTIGGVKVRGFIDLLDTKGRIIDLKTAARKPSGLDPAYAFQLATYKAIGPYSATGEVRLDTLVATKSPNIVTISYRISDADRKLVETVYPRAQAMMQHGMYLPNRGSNLCSRKHCNFWKACQEEFGGEVKGKTDE